MKAHPKLLHQMVRQLVNAKEKFLKDHKSAISVNTWMIKKKKKK
jgi:hypothetical protein